MFGINIHSMEFLVKLRALLLYVRVIESLFGFKHECMILIRGAHLTIDEM